MSNFAEINEDDLTPDGLREGYNTVMLETALTFQSANAEEGEPDIELDAQIEIVRALWAADDKGGTDHAVDHLRGMLEISYTNDGDMPDEIPATRGPAATTAPGAANETFEISFTWTRAQIDAIHQALNTIVDYSSNSTEERAARTLINAIPLAAYQNEGKY